MPSRKTSSLDTDCGLAPPKQCYALPAAFGSPLALVECSQKPDDFWPPECTYSDKVHIHDWPWRRFYNEVRRDLCYPLCYLSIPTPPTDTDCPNKQDPTDWTQVLGFDTAAEAAASNELYEKLRAHGSGRYNWALTRDPKAYRQYLCNKTSTYDLDFNWKVRHACQCPPADRVWKLKKGVWEPSVDNANALDNCTITGVTARKGHCPHEDTPKDSELYSAPTIYQASYKPPSCRSCWESLYLRKDRCVPERAVVRDREFQTVVKIPIGDNKVNKGQISKPDCCKGKGPKNIPRFDGKQTLTEFKTHPPARQTLWASRQDPFQSLQTYVCPETCYLVESSAAAPC